MKPINYDEIFEKAEARRAALEAVTPKLQAIYDQWGVLCVASLSHQPRGWSMGNCTFDLAWRGPCKATCEGSVCTQHATVKCCVCGEQATHECDHTGQFVCGAPLCNNCEGHTDTSKPAGGWGFMNHTTAGRSIMTKLEQAARQALGALEVATTPLAKDRQEVLRAITTLREALSGVQALSAAPAGFVPLAAFDRLHAHAESLAARLLAAEQAAPKAAPGEPGYRENWDAELGRTAMRFVDRAGDVHPGIDDAETICAEFYKAMSEVIERMPHVQRMAAPQQEAQEPCQTCTAMARTVMMDQVSFDRKPDCYGIRQITNDEGVEEWEDIRTSPDVAREEANDMMATGRGEIYEVVPLWTTPQPAPAPLSEMPYEKRKAIQDGEQIGASDAWFHARHNMLDTLDRRNVFRAGFDRGWNAALAAQGGA